MNHFRKCFCLHFKTFMRPPIGSLINESTSGLPSKLERFSEVQHLNLIWTKSILRQCLISTNTHNFRSHFRFTNSFATSVHKHIVLSSPNSVGEHLTVLQKPSALVWNAQTGRQEALSRPVSNRPKWTKFKITKIIISHKSGMILSKFKIKVQFIS